MSESFALPSSADVHGTLALLRAAESLPSVGRADRVAQWPVLSALRGVLEAETPTRAREQATTPEAP